MNRPARFVLVAIALPVAVLAQRALTGAVGGAVHDASDSAVPNAQVTARNLHTGLERSAGANEAGLFRIALLPVGEYEVTAKAQEFNDAKAGPVRVGVGQMVEIDIRLTVGAVTEQVTVQAQVAAIEVTRTSVAPQRSPSKPIHRNRLVRTVWLYSL